MSQCRPCGMAIHDVISILCTAGLVVVFSASKREAEWVVRTYYVPGMPYPALLRFGVVWAGIGDWAP